MLRWLIALFTIPSFATVTIESTHTTRQQAIVAFSVPDPAQCTIVVYSDPAMTLRAQDTDNSVFAGSESCDRASSSIRRSQVTAVLGLRDSALGLDGKLHSRSLAAASPYYFKITDTSSGDSANGEFTTTNIPWGDTHPEGPGFNAAGFGNWAYPDLDWSDEGVDKWYVDPVSGLQFRRIPRVLLGGGGQYDNQPSDQFAFGGAFDVTKEQTGVAKWSNPTNALNTSTAGPFASYSGTTRDPLFLAFDRISQNTPYYVWSSVDDIQMHLCGSAPRCAGEDCKILVCLAANYNPQTDLCTGQELEITLPTSARQTDFPASGNYPAFQFKGWNVGRILRSEEANVWGSKNSGYESGTAADAVSSGSTVTLVIGSDGDTLLPSWAAPGMKLNIKGDWYTIGTLGTAKAFSLQEQGINATGKWFLGSFGVRIRKKTVNNNPIYIDASYSFVSTRQPRITATSGHPWCSNLDFPVSVAADGITAIPTKRARLCQVGEYAGNTQLLMVADDGEIRYLSALQSTQVSIPFSAFSVSDPLSMYGFGPDSTSPGNTALYTVTYNPQKGCQYKNWTGNNYLSVTAPDDCIVYQNITPGSSKASVTQQIASAITSNPIWDSSWDAKICGGSAGDTAAKCFTLTAIAGHYAYFSAGQQDGVQWQAGFDLKTGRLVKILDSFSNTIQGLRFAGIHSGGGTDGDHWIEFDAKVLYGAGWPYLSGPWVLPPAGVSQKSTDGGTYSNDTSLAVNASYACKANSAGITGRQCIWLHLTTNEVCNVGSNSSFSREVTRWPCTWHPGWSSGPLRLQVGDYISIVTNDGHSIDGKAEKMRILAMDPDGSGGYLSMLQRHATCDNPTGDLNGTPPAVMYFRAVDGKSRFPNGWQAYVSPPYACDALLAWVDSSAPPDHTVMPPFVNLAFQHGSGGLGPDGVQATEGGTGIFRTAPFELLPGTSEHVSQNVDNIPWNGKDNGASSSVMEIYTAIMNNAVATPLGRSLAFDARHMNPESGSYPEKGGITLFNQTYTAVPGTGYVYKVNNILGKAADQKNWRPVTMATNALWKDISSPATGDVIDDTSTWSSCYAYKANECRNGSSPGGYYVWAKNAWMEAGGCVISTLKEYSPCTYAPWPQSGWITQSSTQVDDPTGTHIRRLMMGMVGPFSWYHFSAPHPTPDHKFMFVRSSYINGVADRPLLYKLPPPLVDDSIDRSQYIPVTVSLPASPSSARVKFGYAEKGSPTSFFCTSRQEACVVDAGAPPFSYETTDDPNPVDCSGGCSLTIPALSGRILYYRVERRKGSAWIAGPLQVRAVE